MKNDVNTSRTINTPFLRIRDNCLEIQSTTIQLSNISLLSTADITPEKFPVPSIILVLLGLAALKSLLIPAIFAIAIGGLWIFSWNSSVQESKQQKKLTIITNSGHAFPIVFSDQEFLQKVVEMMTDIIRDPAHARSVSINVKDCRFEGSMIESYFEK